MEVIVLLIAVIAHARLPLPTREENTDSQEVGHMAQSKVPRHAGRMGPAIPPGTLALSSSHLSLKAFPCI